MIPFKPTILYLGLLLPYAALVYAFPSIVWWTLFICIGLLGVFVCLLAVWASLMALDEIQILLRAYRHNHSNSCSKQRCNLNSQNG